MDNNLGGEPSLTLPTLAYLQLQLTVRPLSERASYDCYVKSRRQTPQANTSPQKPTWFGVVAYQISDVSEGDAKLVATLVVDSAGETFMRPDSLADRDPLMFAGIAYGIMLTWCVHSNKRFPGDASQLVRQLSTHSLAITDTVEVEECSIEEAGKLTFAELRAMSESQIALERGGLEGWLEGPDI